MVDTIEDYEELRELAELELQLNMVKYIKDEIQNPLDTEGTQIRELNMALDSEYRAIEEQKDKEAKEQGITVHDMDMTESIEEQLNDSALQAAMAYDMACRLHQSPETEADLAVAESYIDDDISDLDDLDEDAIEDGLYGEDDLDEDNEDEEPEKDRIYGDDEDEEPEEDAIYGNDTQENEDEFAEEDIDDELYGEDDYTEDDSDELDNSDEESLHSDSDYEDEYDSDEEDELDELYGDSDEDTEENDELDGLYGEDGIEDEEGYNYEGSNSPGALFDEEDEDDEEGFAEYLGADEKEQSLFRDDDEEENEDDFDAYLGDIEDEPDDATSQYLDELRGEDIDDEDGEEDSIFGDEDEDDEAEDDEDSIFADYEDGSEDEIEVEEDEAEDTEYDEDDIFEEGFFGDGSEDAQVEDDYSYNNEDNCTDEDSILAELFGDDTPEQFDDTSDDTDDDFVEDDIDSIFADGDDDFDDKDSKPSSIIPQTPKASSQSTGASRAASPRKTAESHSATGQRPKASTPMSGLFLNGTDRGAKTQQTLDSLLRIGSGAQKGFSAIKGMASKSAKHGLAGFSKKAEMELKQAQDDEDEIIDF